jgi:acyl dehydratase
MELTIGQEWEHDFCFSQEQVNDFAKLTGDTNPIHLNMEYAAQTAFKKPIMHGMLGACIFSKVFGTICPGPKSIYLSQSLEFKKPLYPDQNYTAKFTIRGMEKKKIVVRTLILNKTTLEELTDGEAILRVR